MQCKQYDSNQHQYHRHCYRGRLASDHLNSCWGPAYPMWIDSQNLNTRTWLEMHVCSMVLSVEGPKSDPTHMLVSHLSFGRSTTMSACWKANEPGNTCAFTACWQRALSVHYASLLSHCGSTYVFECQETISNKYYLFEFFAFFFHRCLRVHNLYFRNPKMCHINFWIVSY